MEENVQGKEEGLCKKSPSDLPQQNSADRALPWDIAPERGMVRRVVEVRGEARPVWLVMRVWVSDGWENWILVFVRLVDLRGDFCCYRFFRRDSSVERRSIRCRVLSRFYRALTLNRRRRAS